MADDKAVRGQLADFLDWHHAHASFDDAVKGMPPRLRGTVPVAMPSARGRPASVISATLHLPAAIASAAWATCST